MSREMYLLQENTMLLPLLNAENILFLHFPMLVCSLDIVVSSFPWKPEALL